MAFARSSRRVDGELRDGGGTGVLSSKALDGELGTSGDGEHMGCIGVGPKGHMIHA